MTEKRTETVGQEDEVAQILAYVRSLDPQAQVEASLDIEQATRDRRHHELPVWLRRFSQEAIQNVRQRSVSVISRQSVPDTNSN